jgi:nitrite reductase/ring-hydroxylating ferredoxin subunit
MALVKLAVLNDVPPGSAIHIEVGEGAVAICNVRGVLYAMDGICPHSGGPLGHGALHGNMLVCPWHAWDFDCTTGFSDVDDEIKLATYPVKEEDGEIFVELP